MALWEIPKCMQDAIGDKNNYKFLLTIADYFSKYRWCRIIPTKGSETIIEVSGF